MAFDTPEQRDEHIAALEQELARLKQFENPRAAEVEAQIRLAAGKPPAERAKTATSKKAAQARRRTA